MARRDRLEERLSRLSSLGGGERTPEVVERLRSALADSSNLVVEAAARAALALEVGELSNELSNAFDRFFEDRSERDKGCVAKTACLAALIASEEAGVKDLLRASRHVQMEAVYGPSVDVAGPLRAEAIAGLLSLGYDDLPEELIRLLNDKLSEVRLAAVQAAGHMGGRAGTLLLRYKATVGDEEPGITSECFSALMRTENKSARAFVIEQLRSASSEVALGAALALGEFASPDHFDILVEARSLRMDEEFRRGSLLPISLLRIEAALEYLLEVLRTEQPIYAAEAVKVLRIFADDERRFAEIEAIVRERNDAFVQRVFDIKYAR